MYKELRKYVTNHVHVKVRGETGWSVGVGYLPWTSLNLHICRNHLNNV